ncbi:MAG: acyl-CoA dehydrogenase family protein, partial [Clostridia bacterium]|nr:acyl-CoA dehydrogenase family protein [Clostridia bacterium]
MQWLDLHFSPEDEAFRRSLRDWLEANLPPGWNTPAYQPPEDFDEWVAFLRDLDRRLYEGGWAGIHWPREYGGRGATLVQQLIFAEESARYNLPQTISYLGKNMLGPTLMQYGTEA